MQTTKKIVVVGAIILFLGMVCLQSNFSKENNGILYANIDVDTNDVSSIYNTENQQEINDCIEAMKSTTQYTQSSPLLLYNPYGTNTLSMYMYFETKEKAKVSYTIHVDDDTIADFTQTIEDDFMLEHEAQLIGLIPDMNNTITFYLTSQDGSVREYSYDYEIQSLKGNEEIQLDKSEGESTQTLSNGLYVILGNDSSEEDFMYFYDNDGVIRGEVPIEEYRSHRLIFNEDKMYFSYNKTKIAEMNNLGQITATYDLGNYELHHDYVFDDNGNILVLATDTTADTQEDMIIKLNLETKKVANIIDLGDLLIAYKNTTTSVDNTWDWVHLNTIQYLGDDQIIVSSRETSSIIKISDINKTPEIDYMIGEETFWKDSGYASLLLDKVGDFALQTGQHTVTYMEDDTLAQGQYYLYMFNNNYGYSATNKLYDWSQVIGCVTGKADENSVSKYYKYLVDENNRTYTLVDSFDVPYSSYVSSAQNTEYTTIINSGMAKNFQEYDSNHNLIQSFNMESDKFIYRVYKYTFDDFYFNKIDD